MSSPGKTPLVRPPGSAMAHPNAWMQYAYGLEAEVVRLRQLENLCRRWFTDDDLSVYAPGLHEEIMAWFAEEVQVG